MPARCAPAIHPVGVDRVRDRGGFVEDLVPAVSYQRRVSSSAGARWANWRLPSAATMESSPATISRVRQDSRWASRSGAAFVDEARQPARHAATHQRIAAVGLDHGPVVRDAGRRQAVRHAQIGRVARHPGQRASHPGRHVHHEGRRAEHQCVQFHRAAARSAQPPARPGCGPAEWVGGPARGSRPAAGPRRRSPVIFLDQRGGPPAGTAMAAVVVRAHHPAARGQPAASRS